MIYEFFYYIFDMLGISNFLLDPGQLCVFIAQMDYTRWTNLFNPEIWVSLLIYGGFAFGCIYVLMWLPFRFFKRLIRVPDKKGKKC